MRAPADGFIYFISDFHLGLPDLKSSRERERKILRWLDEIAPTAKEIYFVGDVFDVWFEYKRAVPKGFVRFLGRIAELSDKGIPVHFFLGNHDMWQFGYLEDECGVTMHKEPILREWNGKKFFIGHGDGLGPGDGTYKFIKKVFRFPLSQWFYARLHPNFGIWLAEKVSRKGMGKKLREAQYFGDDKEFLTLFCKDYLKTQHVDYFIFGHRHLALDLRVGEHTRYLNLGDWLRFNSYAVFDGQEMHLKYFEQG